MVVIGCLAALAFWLARPRVSKPTQSQAAIPESTQALSNAASNYSLNDENLPIEITNKIVAIAPRGKALVAVSRSQPAENLQPAASRPEPSPYTRDLINKLFKLDQGAVPQTPEQVAAWKQDLRQLVQQGAAAVPAIREFLEKNVDLGFGNEGVQALGYGSARYALFDALAQIGGPEAVGALMGTLQTTADPREIALLAQDLEQIAPEQHRHEILEATRQALAMAGAGKLADTDVGPLFEVLYKYGGASIVSELEQNGGRWRYYSAIALAQLPDGAGVPALIRMVRDPGGGAVKNVPALEMVAQSASQYPEARAALLDLVRGNSIPARTWPYLISVLGGDQMQYRDSISDSSAARPVSDVKSYHIAAGNQNFYSAPIQGLTPDQINRQIALIDELLSATAADPPQAIQTLQTARNSLLKRLH